MRNNCNIAKLIITILSISGLIVSGFTTFSIAQGNDPDRSAFSSLSVERSSAATVRFAAIGDFGTGNSQSMAVATKVGEWNPDFIITAGDNNYLNGAASTMDQNVGILYHNYIYPFVGTIVTPTPISTPGPSSNRFWPTLGNHDWNGLVSSNGTVTGPYFDYFTLPGNERYYDFVEGPVHFFMIDSDAREPDGVTQSSTQAQWLQNRMAGSTVPWKIVVMHHAPYSSSSTHGSNPNLQWDYKGWGADAVIAGHDHVYERLEIDGLTYFVNGLGGAGAYGFGAPVPGSVVRYNAQYGAMLIEANEQEITFRMITTSGVVVDQTTLSKPQATETPTITSTPMATLTAIPSPIPSVTALATIPASLDYHLFLPVISG